MRVPPAVGRARFPWPLRAGGRWTRCLPRGPRPGPGPTRPVWTRARTVPYRCRRPCSRRRWARTTTMTFRVPGMPSTGVRGRGRLPRRRVRRGRGELRRTGIRRGRVGPRTAIRRGRLVRPALRGVRSRPTPARSPTRRPARRRLRGAPGARAPRLRRARRELRARVRELRLRRRGLVLRVGMCPRSSCRRSGRRGTRGLTGVMGPARAMGLVGPTGLVGFVALTGLVVWALVVLLSVRLVVRIRVAVRIRLAVRIPLAV